ncbi:MAG TPA: NAD-dependent epimerase/dehydratase family protein [Bacteroidia bacterium]|nr:NAD-dependent epimerase/dehydratase family protein [Bacteroidia bacterium]HNU32023.1 NAD-dependent epimerase/dehydratase family protein [Bacteroidia bacterium]
MSHILVTGGTGLLGSQLVFDLVISGEKVRVLKRPTSSTTLLKNKFKQASHLFNQIEFVEGDVLDVFSLEDALDGITYVYHCAAMVSFIAKDNDLMQQINSEGTANMVNACLNKRIKKLCHVSSVAALGRTEKSDVIDENAVWENTKHNSNYAISKYNAEREVWRGIFEGLNAVMVNPTVIIGEGNFKTDSSVLFANVYKGLKFYSEGINGFVDVRDVSHCMIQLMNSDVTNERFIVCSDNQSYKEVLFAIADALQVKRPSIKVNSTLAEMAWRVEMFKSFFSGNKPMVSKETARTALNKHFYSSEKIKKTLGIDFIPVDKSIKNWANSFNSQ